MTRVRTIESNPHDSVKPTADVKSHLDLFDLILDPLDGVPVDIIPRIHQFLAHHLCSNHWKREGEEHEVMFIMEDGGPSKWVHDASLLQDFPTRFLPLLPAGSDSSPMIDACRFSYIYYRII